MNLIRVAAGVLNQTPLDWDGNAQRIVAAIAAAREQGASLLCLPELCISGYGCEDAFHSPAVHELALRVLGELLPETRGMIVSLGLPLYHAGGVYNMACLVADGELLGLVGKQNLAGDGLHYEPRWFKPWPVGQQVELRLLGQDVPVGDMLFEIGGVRIGFEICEDAWVARRPGSELAMHSVDVILNPSASHFAFGKEEVRRRFVLEGSRAFHSVYVYANLLGNEAGRAIYDGGASIASAGRALAIGPRFSFREFEITSAVVDLDIARMSRARMASFRPQIGDAAKPCVRRSFDYPAVEPETHDPDCPLWEQGESVKEEEFTRAVTLGLCDYLRKSRSHGAVVSLSGGADSSATAVLVALMIRLGVEQLGLAGFREKFGHVPALEQAESVRAIVRRMLVCAYQATRNSGETTSNAAREVAEAIGAEFLRLDVDSLVQGYQALIADALGRELTWEQDDIALQNIQARARGPSVWMLANIRRFLLLATSNRSEAAVGYATMDGDTCGGLSPIAGIDKAFLRRWLRWMEITGPLGLSPLPALAAVNVQQPTAELRPRSAGQTDESDLMPYDLLDAMERAAIRDKKGPREVFRLMSGRFPEYERRQLAAWVERFFQLWSRNQWKRERYAPSFHVDDENLDPKTWCRFPILSGGYARDLREMWAEVEP